MKFASFLIMLAFLFLAAPALATTPDQIHKIMNQSGGKAQSVQSLRFSGNVKTKKFHNDGCKYFDCRDCTKYFKTREAALKEGFEACGRCGG